jgi:hypothetical protein
MYQGPFWNASILSVVQGIPLYYGTRMLFTVFITVRCLDEIWTRWNTFPPSSLIFLRYIWVLFSRVSLVFHAVSFLKFSHSTHACISLLSRVYNMSCLSYPLLWAKVLQRIKLISCIKSILINFVWTGANLCICVVSVGHNVGIISGYIQLNDWILQYALQEVKEEEGWLAKHKVNVPAFWLARLSYTTKTSVRTIFPGNVPVGYLTNTILNIDSLTHSLRAVMTSTL